jgi:hypothetical protein
VLAVAAVHTTGINWDSLLVVIGTIVSAFAAAAAYIGNRMDANRQRTEQVIVSKAEEIINAVASKHLDDYHHRRRRRQ